MGLEEGRDAAGHGEPVREPGRRTAAPTPWPLRTGPCSTRLQNSLSRGSRSSTVVAGDQAGVDGADRGADHPVRLDAGLVQRLVDAGLIGPERAAALQHQHDLPEFRGILRSAFSAAPASPRAPFQ